MCCDSHTRVRFLSFILLRFVFVYVAFDRVPETTPSGFSQGHGSTSCMCHGKATSCLLWQDAAVHLVLYVLLFPPFHSAQRSAEKAGYSIFFFFFFFLLRPFLNDTELEPCRRRSLYFVQWSFPTNVSTFISSPLSSFPVLIKDQSLTPRSTLGVSRGVGGGWGRGALCGAAGSR